MDEISQIGPSTRIQVSGQGVVSELKDVSIIMHLHEGIYYRIDKVGTTIWRMIQEPVSFSDLIDRLLEEYEVERAVCEEDTRALLQQLCAKDLVTIDA